MQVLKAILVKKYLHFHDPSLITLDWFAAVVRFTLHTVTKGAIF